MQNCVNRELTNRSWIQYLVRKLWQEPNFILCFDRADALGNLPMSRVKFNAKVEYEYLDNFKVLQQCFKRNGIDKVSWGMRAIIGRPS